MTTLKISVGDYKAIPWESSSIKISVIDITKEKFRMRHYEEERYGAEISVDTGGGIVYGGDYVIESGVNQFKIPAKKSQVEEQYSIYSFSTDRDYFSFLRIYVEHINPHAKEVTVNLFCYST